MQHANFRRHTQPVGAARARFRRGARVGWAGLSIAALGACLGCASDHYLGDLNPRDIVEAPDDAAASGADFSVAPLLGPADVVMPAEAWSFYNTYAGIGDVDGDGFGDLATFGQEPVHGAFYVHLRYGGPRPTDDAASSLAFATDGPRLVLDADGETNLGIEGIFPAGDLDADGYADFLIGLGSCPDSTTEQGAFVIYGGPTRLTTGRLEDVAVHLEPRADAYHTTECGLSYDIPRVAALGDFDGDGFDDFMLTDSPYSTRQELLANVYLFYGRAGRLTNGDASKQADARLTTDHATSLVALGDVDADGLGDVAFSLEPLIAEATQPEYRWLAGRRARFSGALTLRTLTTPFLRPTPAGDLDGDGVRDVILYDASGVPRLFYGAPGLFAGGVDLSLAAATFDPVPDNSPRTLIAGSDLDGDGDDETVATEILSYGFPMTSRSLALISGSSNRIGGQVVPPEPGNPYWADGVSLVERVVPIGDLDGDGAGGQLMTQSHEYSAIGDAVVDDTVVEVDGLRYTRDEQRPIMFRIHYGTPGGVTATPH